MTENKAIEILEEITVIDDSMYAYDPVYMEALEIAISAIKEIQQYREIGSVEECRKAVEKHKVKKIIIRNWNPTRCPTCDYELSTSLGDGYYKHPIFLKRCPECGQAIQWYRKFGREYAENRLSKELYDRNMK